MYQATKQTTVRIRPTVSGPNGRILPVHENNQIAGFVEYHPLIKKFTIKIAKTTIRLCVGG